MQQFKLEEDTWKKIRKKFILTSVIAIILPLIIISLLELAKPTFDWTTCAISIGAFLVVVIFAQARAYRMQKKLIASYNITITDHDITRDQWNTKPLTINFMEIKQIIKTKKGGFVIKGVSKTDLIYIPTQIENKEMLEDKLTSFAPIAIDVKDPMNINYKIGRRLLSLAMFFVLILVKDKIISSIAGLIAIGLTIWTLADSQSSKNMPESAKKRSWGMIIFIIVVAYLILTKFFTIP